MKNKFRKTFKSIPHGISSFPSFLHGSYAIQSLEETRISQGLLETCRRKLRSSLNRKGKLWARLYPDIPVTQKPSEVRMGKGKGSPKYWIAKVWKGQFLFELEGITHYEAMKAFKSMQNKIGIKTKLIYDTKKFQTTHC